MERTRWAIPGTGVGVDAVYQELAEAVRLRDEKRAELAAAELRLDRANARVQERVKGQPARRGRPRKAAQQHQNGHHEVAA